MHDFAVFVTFAVGDIIVCIYLHCGFDHGNSPPCGCFFLPHATEKLLLVSPRFWFAMGSFSFWVVVGSY